MMTLVIGGARSGKSALAERIVRATGGAPVYIATAAAGDAEMAARIARHRADREAQGSAGWRTIEEGRDMATALASLAPGDAALIDCATLWLSNVMLAGGDPEAEAEIWCAAMAACPAPLVVVTNEVGQGIVPDNRLARRFRDAQGRLNQRLAAQAGCAVAVIAGLPLVLKGALPAGLA